jgi:hypothetical protein
MLLTVRVAPPLFVTVKVAVPDAPTLTEPALSVRKNEVQEGRVSKPELLVNRVWPDPSAFIT